MLEEQSMLRVYLLSMRSDEVEEVFSRLSTIHLRVVSFLIKIGCVAPLERPYQSLDENISTQLLAFIVDDDCSR